MSKLVYSAIRTPDGTILSSVHRHDYVTHTDKNGESYMLDGGLEYQRTSINKEPAENISLSIGDPHNKIREAVTWGSYGKKGNGPLRRVPVSEMSDDHLNAVVVLPYVHQNIGIVFLDELAYRDLHNIFIKG